MGSSIPPPPSGLSAEGAHVLFLGAGRRTGPSRLLVFPVLLNLWPLLLLLSQKALVPVGLLLLGSASRLTRRNLVTVAWLIAVGGLSLLLQPWNEFAAAHYLGFVLFLLSVPLINAAVRGSGEHLIKWLSILSLSNALLAFLFYFLEVDLSQYRGLNRIVGDDDATHRVFYETTSLLAVFSVTFLRKRWLRWICGAIVAAYALLLAKSVFVILLFLFNHLAPRILSGRVLSRIAVSAFFLGLAIGAPAMVAVARPDFALSVGMKLLQFDAVINDGSPILSGRGWGYVIDDVVTSTEQPYQVEMQLPMLLTQVGLLVLIPYVVAMVSLFRSISSSWTATMLRSAAYFAIGFANPWLFVPSWYLTTALIFRRLDNHGRPRLVRIARV